MNKIIISFFAFAALSISALAQSPVDIAASKAVQETQNVQSTCVEYPSEALTSSMSASLAKQGKSLDVINSDGSIYVIGMATTACPSNRSGFILSRNVAFSIAEMTAKQNLLRIAGEDFSSGRGFSVLDVIVNGGDSNAAKAAQEVIAESKSHTSEQVYAQPIRTVCAGMIQGCAIVRTAEGECGNNDYQVAVCIKYCPEFQSLSNILKSGKCGSIPIGKAGDSRAKIMNMSESDLVYKLGSWVTYDTNGHMVIYGFGQEEIQSTGTRESAAVSRAQSKARLQAVNNVKNFVAEDLVSEETRDDAEKLNECFDDGSSVYLSQEKWQNAVGSKVTTLKSLATQQVRTWRGTHPVSGQEIVGVIVCWTYENSQTANALRETIDNNGRQNVNGSSAKTVPEKTKKGQIVITGDDEDL